MTLVRLLATGMLGVVLLGTRRSYADDLFVQNIFLLSERTVMLGSSFQNRRTLTDDISIGDTVSPQDSMYEVDEYFDDFVLATTRADATIQATSGNPSGSIRFWSEFTMIAGPNVPSTAETANMFHADFNTVAPGRLLIRLVGDSSTDRTGASIPTVRIYDRTVLDPTTDGFRALFSFDGILDGKTRYLSYSWIDPIAASLVLTAPSQEYMKPIDEQTNLANNRVEAYFEWGLNILPGMSPDYPLLPRVYNPETGAFGFVVPTLGTPEDVLFIDPVIAIGYNYTTDAIPFRSVLIPEALPNGDAAFELLFGGYTIPLLAGDTYDFTTLISDGVREFTIRGIDPSEMLDPTNPVAFVTGLAFMESGLTDVTMTAISSVPEFPSSLLAMIPMGLFLFAQLRRKRSAAG